jgi:hypothetical protein
MYPNLRIIRMKIKTQKSKGKSQNYKSKVKTLIISSHCEERSDETISCPILSLRVPMLRHEAISLNELRIKNCEL